MTPEEYLKDRVEDQIAWYGEKSAWNKRYFIVFQIITLVASAAVPVFSILTDQFWARVTVAILGSATAVTTGLVSLYQFREHWVDYRTTAESLKHEKFMYQTQTGPYSGDDAFATLVERVEALVSDQNTSWNQRLSTLQSKKTKAS